MIVSSSLKLQLFISIFTYVKIYCAGVADKQDISMLKNKTSTKDVISKEKYKLNTTLT